MIMQSAAPKRCSPSLCPGTPIASGHMPQTQTSGAAIDTSPSCVRCPFQRRRPSLCRPLRNSTYSTMPALWGTPHPSAHTRATKPPGMSIGRAASIWSRGVVSDGGRNKQPWQQGKKASKGPCPGGCRKKCCCGDACGRGTLPIHASTFQLQSACPDLLGGEGEVKTTLLSTCLLGNNSNWSLLHDAPTCFHQRHHRRACRLE